MAQALTPQEAAAYTGLSVHTLRWYERQGLIHSIGRTRSGHRRYNPGDIEWVQLLQCLRATGMPIRSMLRFAELTRGGQETVADRLRLLRAHEQDVRLRMAELEQNLQAVTNKIRYYSEQLDETETRSCDPRSIDDLAASAPGARVLPS